MKHLHPRNLNVTPERRVSLLFFGFQNQFWSAHYFYSFKNWLFVALPPYIPLLYFVAAAPSCSKHIVRENASRRVGKLLSKYTLFTVLDSTAKSLLRHQSSYIQYDSDKQINNVFQYDLSRAQGRVIQQNFCDVHQAGSILIKNWKLKKRQFVVKPFHPKNVYEIF